MKKIIHFVFFCLLCYFGFSQTSRSDSITNYNSAISEKNLARISSIYTTSDEAISKKSLKILEDFQKQENKLKRIVEKKDSGKAVQLFAYSKDQIQSFKEKLKSQLSTNQITLIKNYIPGLDSINTAAKFLSKSVLSGGQLQKLTAITQQIKQLQGSFQNANTLKDFISERQAQLSDQLNSLGVGKQIASMNKELFSYQEELVQYKDILNDQQRQEQILMAAVSKVPTFKNFWQSNSALSSLYPNPGNQGTMMAAVGLQTNKDVSSNIQKRMGVDIQDGGASVIKFMSQQTSGAQDQMDQLKQKLEKLNMSGGNSGMTLPNYAPNAEAKKSFLQRLELGCSIQNMNNTNFLPTISNIGLSVGYRLNKGATFGIGINYLLGLGSGINHIHLSNQGIGVRNYLDIKLKGTFWLTGGFEYNYMQQFEGLSTLKNISIWQKSALIGLMKKYNVGKKSGNIQLLYDLLAHSEIPQGQAFRIRFGFNLN